MKQKPVSILLLFFMLFYLLTGCGSTDPGIKKGSVLEPPVIKHVQSGKIIDDKYLATRSFLIGDTVNFVISLKGSTKYITNVHLKEYYPESVNQDHTEFKPIEAVRRSTKSKSIMLKEPIEFIGPPGERRFVIQVEDKENNFSNAIDLYLFIH